MICILPAQLCKARERDIYSISLMLPIITRVGDTDRETDTEKEKELEKSQGKMERE